jgi:hypothetical protein
MKYRDLIQFEPVTEVIQLRWADEKVHAEKLVSTYVISDRMADVILSRIIPALELVNDQSGRGLFIVGNYGTGKSHLMSVITAIAEHADLLEKISNQIVSDGLKPIAGKFKVIRQETGATEMHLRDVVFNDLEAKLLKIGIQYHFPPMDKASNNKQLLVEMMVQFNKNYPDHGLLIALDELLDFLRARNDQQLVMDLNFLREVGEACELTSLRFITGIQEALFDNPRFQFAADSIRRVRARFDQLSIVREDLAYVISQRLLAKTDRQLVQIKKHLEKFTPLYTSMAERLDSFISLFPVHPAYLEVFEQVTIGERRDLLKAISSQMNAILDIDVPENQPGLIAFDAYWNILSGDPAYRTIPEVRSVQDKVRVLSERIQLAPDMKDYRDAALRLINGLAVHRLTVGDIYAPIGMTPVELRDRLCISLPLPEADADFLLATVETVLRETTRVVSGQFISHNRENDQYYLDLKKDIDFDALIEQRASALDANTINRYYFEILVRSLELSDSTYVPGFRIWQREIDWPGQGITRQGYIFLGAPNERSTAHPERDFYIHFLGISNGNNSLKHLPDEVYFSLISMPDDLMEPLRQYSGAREMSTISSGSNKDQYDRKAELASRQVSTWLRDNILRVFQITYKNETNTVADAVSRYRLSLKELSFRDQVFRLSGVILSEYFKQKFPLYPHFSSIEFSSETAHQACEAALRVIASGPATKMALIVLDGLGLAHLENNSLLWTIQESPYASYFQEKINELEGQKVLNRNALIQGEPGAERDVHFHLEGEWLVVILASLVRNGSIHINLPGQQIADGEVDSLIRLDLDTLMRFTSISRPKVMPELALRELLAGLNIDPDLLADPRAMNSIVNQLQNKVLDELDQVVRWIESLRIGPRFWREPIFSPIELQDFRTNLDNYRQLLDNLQRLNTPVRLRNLTYGVGELKALFKNRQRIADLNGLTDLLSQLQPRVDYLVQAESLLPSEHQWQAQAVNTRREILNSLKNPAERNSTGIAKRWLGRLENLQNDYINEYFKLHQNNRLDRSLDESKRNLTADPRWVRLRALSQLQLLSERQLHALQDSLSEVKSCPTLQLVDLQTHAACPYCGFSPISEKSTIPAAKRLDDVELQFEQLSRQWITVLITNLETLEAKKNLELIGEREQNSIKQFMQTKVLPERITDSFLDGLNDTLQGLEKVVIDANEMLLALTSPGMPCTLDAFNTRLRDYLAAHLVGKDPNKIRIQIDW